MDKNPRKRIAVTMGDPAGIGPEIVLKAALDDRVHQAVDLLCIGDAAELEIQARHFNLPVRICPDAEVESKAGFLPVLSLGKLAKTTQFGGILSDYGRASYEYLKEAVRLAQAGQVAAIVTAPVQKEAWKAGGVAYLGHTEALADLFKSTAQTLFVTGRLRIFFLTRHVSLKRAIELITVQGLFDLLRHAKEALRSFGLDNPSLAVAGLNPHAGDGGLFGQEETEVIVPAVKAACQAGIKACGPFAADSVFHHCAAGRYDAVIALYHDQGHIAAKMHDFHGTVSVTTGLPVVRTSVDHGTAYDIAGQGAANPVSLIEAILLAGALLHKSRTPVS